MKYQAIFFDLDGTLVDSFPNYFQIMKLTLNQFGVSFKPLQLKSTFSMTIHQALAKLRIPVQLASSFESAYQSNRQRLQPKPILFSGIQKMFAGLEATLFPALGIVTSGGPGEIATLNQNFSFMRKVWVTVDADTVSSHKPAPEPLLDAISQTGMSKHHTLYVGDAKIDEATAFNAGVDFGVAGWGANPKLTFNTAKYNFHSPLDILKIYKSGKL